MGRSLYIQRQAGVNVSQYLEFSGAKPCRITHKGVDCAGFGARLGVFNVILMGFSGQFVVPFWRCAGVCGVLAQRPGFLGGLGRLPPGKSRKAWWNLPVSPV